MAVVVGTVSKIQGVVKAINPVTGEERTLQEGSPVYAGEVIQTSSQGGIVVNMNSGSLLTLGRDTQMRLDDDVTQTANTVDSGTEGAVDVAVLQQAVLEGNFEALESTAVVTASVSVNYQSAGFGDIVEGFNSMAQNESNQSVDIDEAIVDDQACSVVNSMANDNTRFENIELNNYTPTKTVSNSETTLVANDESGQPFYPESLGKINNVKWNNEDSTGSSVTFKEYNGAGSAGKSSYLEIVGGQEENNNDYYELNVSVSTRDSDTWLGRHFEYFMETQSHVAISLPSNGKLKLLTDGVKNLTGNESGSEFGKRVILLQGAKGAAGELNANLFGIDSLDKVFNEVRLKSFDYFNQGQPSGDSSNYAIDSKGGAATLIESALTIGDADTDDLASGQVLLQNLVNDFRSDLNGEYVENMAEFLQSEDGDGHSENRITISASDHAAFEGGSLNLKTASQAVVQGAIESAGQNYVNDSIVAATLAHDTIDGLHYEPFSGLNGMVVDGQFEYDAAEGAENEQAEVKVSEENKSSKQSGSAEMTESGSSDETNELLELDGDPLDMSEIIVDGNFQEDLSEYWPDKMKSNLYTGVEDGSSVGGEERVQI